MLSRILILIVAIATLAPVASAQRVFRASSIDLEQNDRIDSLESKVSRIESSVSKLVAAIESKAVVQPATIVAEPVRTITPVSVQRTQAAMPSGYYSQSELISIVRSAYPNGNYTRYADVSPRSAVWSHLMDGNHQFTSAQVQGLPQDIALGLHGLHHAGRIKATRSGGNVSYAQPAMPQVTYSQPAYSQPSQVFQQAGGCANGQCPTPARSQSVRRSFGIFRR